MANQVEYETARRRATAIYGFYRHAAVFGAVMLLLVLIDLLASPGTTWFHWPLMGWGLAVALHGARVFLLSDQDAMIDALTERELRRSSHDSDSSRP